MPSADEHLQTFARFEVFSLRVRAAFPEWAITGLFYAALHLVDAFFDLSPAAEGVRGYLNHEDRTLAVRHQLLEIHEPYRLLKLASENARYRGVILRPADIDTARRLWYDPLRQTMQEKIEAHGKHLPAEPSAHGPSS